MDGTLAAFPCGYAFLGPDRMVFGTDYPMGPEHGGILHPGEPDWDEGDKHPGRRESNNTWG